MEETVSVISPEYAEKVCSHCGERALNFNAQCFKEPFRPIITACKSCIEKRAGGADPVFVKTTWPKLRQTWQNNRRGDVPANFKAAVEQRRKQRQNAVTAFAEPKTAVGT